MVFLGTIIIVGQPVFDILTDKVGPNLELRNVGVRSQYGEAQLGSIHEIVEDGQLGDGDAHVAVVVEQVEVGIRIRWLFVRAVRVDGSKLTYFLEFMPQS